MQSSAANYLFCFWGTFHGKEFRYLIDIIELNFTVVLLNNEVLALPAEITSNESLSYLSRPDNFLHSSPYLVNKSQSIFNLLPLH